MPRFRPALVLVLALVVAPVVASAARADDAADATAFLTALYKGYGGKGGQVDPFGQEAARWFDASLLTLIKADFDAHPGDVPDLDGDPICNCQDDGGMKVSGLKASPAAAGRWTGEATLDFPDKRHEVVRFTLVKTAKGFRIWDISEEGTPSLRKFLEDAAKGGKAP